MGKALKPIVDFFVALATSVRNWRVGRGMDAETGAPLQAQSVLEAFLQRQREEAKAMAELNRRRWEQSKQDGAALAEALERSPHQIVLDDDGTPLKFHINKETRDNWDATITWLTNGKPKSADEMRRLVTVFFGAPGVLRFIENETHVFGEVTGWNLNENIPFMIEAGTLLKIYEGTSFIGRSMGYAHGHNLSSETMCRIIDAIDSPVAVILERDRDGYPTGSLIFLTELTERNISEDGTPVDNHVYIPIRITPQTIGRKIFYRISSAYGLSDARKWNGLFARIRRNPKDILFANRGKIEKYRTPFGERYKNPNGYRSGRGQNQSTKDQPLDLRRMADELTVGLSGTRWVPDEKGLAKFAPNSSLPSAPSIVDQTETETQGENNETYHDSTQSSSAGVEAISGGEPKRGDTIVRRTTFDVEDDEGRNVGYRYYLNDTVIASVSIITDDKSTYVERIDVGDKYQNLGFGTRILKQLADEYGDVYVAPDNEDAKRLYERIGYDEVGSRAYNESYYAVDEGYGVYSISGDSDTDIVIEGEDESGGNTALGVGEAYHERGRAASTKEDLIAYLERAMAPNTSREYSIVEFSKVPPILAWLGIDRKRIIARANKLKRIRDEHHLDTATLAELPERLASPVAVFKLPGDEFIVLTDLLADDGTGRMAPVMVALKNASLETDVIIKSAYSRAPQSEDYYAQCVENGYAV